MAAPIHPLHTPREAPSTAPIEAPLPLPQAIPPGRLVELSGSARTTTAAAVLLHAQQLGETSAWIQNDRGDLFPPDLAAMGIDLDALVVVHTPSTAGSHAPCRAAELLLRSGAFGLVIVDMTQGRPPGAPSAWQGRLLGLARQHDSRVVLLSDSRDDEPSLGPLIGLRFAGEFHRSSAGRFVVQHALLKNKSGGPVPTRASQYRGPWGLR